MAFGSFIRSEREKKEIQMNDFARQLGISPAYWSRIERELEKAPKDELITKAAEALGLNPDEAFIEASRLPPVRSGEKMASAPALRIFSTLRGS